MTIVLDEDDFGIVDCNEVALLHYVLNDLPESDTLYGGENYYFTFLSDTVSSSPAIEPLSQAVHIVKSSYEDTGFVVDGDSPIYFRLIEKAADLESRVIYSELIEPDGSCLVTEYEYNGKSLR